MISDLPGPGAPDAPIPDSGWGLDPAAAAPPQDFAGWDRYEVGELLGEGGMGRVFRAWDRRLARPVALKFLRYDDPVLARRLIREARLQAGLQSEHVVQVHEAGTHLGQPYIAMQLVPGRTLREAAPDLPLEDKVRIVATVARALDLAHGRGVVHRDLKPSNILVAFPEGRPKPYLADFGAAQQPGDTLLTASGGRVGTLAYMSPEQLEGGRPLDARSDLHSLGTILYELLAGRPPFGAGAGAEPTPGTELAALQRLLHEDPPPPSRLRPGISRDLDTLVLKCLEKDPARRFGSALELAEELERVLAGRPILTRPAGPVDRAAKALGRLRRNPMARRVLGAAAAALALLGAGAAWSLARAERRAQRLAHLSLQLSHLEDLARASHLRPLHDLTRDQEAIRREMAAIRAGAGSFGGWDEGPRAYALGRGHLALGEPEDAARELQRAWDQGFHAPEVDRALGRALGAVYQARLLAGAWSMGTADPSPELQELRDRSARHLVRAADSFPEEADRLRAEADLEQERPEEALRRLDGALARDPDSAEALTLRGAALQSLAVRAAGAGRHATSLAALRGALDAFARAGQVHRSDPALDLASGECYGFMLYLTNFLGGDPEACLARARAAADRAAAAIPAHPAPCALRSRAAYRCFRALELRGEDPLPALEAAVRDGEAALAKRRTPGLEAWTGAAHWALAAHRAARGLDPAAELAAGEALLRPQACAPGVLDHLAWVLADALPYAQAAARGPARQGVAAVAARARSLGPDHRGLQALAVPGA